MSHDRQRATIIVLATIFLALHLPYLPASLEDLDSVNFALGIRDFDVVHHQPHPPGYPVYMAVAKGVHAAVPNEATTLPLISVVSGAAGVLAIGALFLPLAASHPMWPLAGVAVAVTSPLYWFTAARPLSDMAGLAAAVGVQALTIRASTAGTLAAAAFGAGLASGIRSQVAWLTVPLLTIKLLVPRGLLPGDQPATGSHRVATGSVQRAVVVLAFGVGVLVWLVPTMIISGGPAAYRHALFDQGAEDFGNIQMLWTTHNARAAADALYYTLVAPWATRPIAGIVLASALFGIVWSWRHARSALLTLSAAFGPYLVLDVLFQETFTGRYALPVVVPLAWLAVTGLRFVPSDAGLAVALAVAMFDAHIGGTSLAAYASEKAPAFKLLDDMERSVKAGGAPPVLAMDRRNSFDFRRPLIWLGTARPPFARVLASPPQHEWLEAVHYWNSGGRAPVWFVVDPARTTIDLVQHGEPAKYRWPMRYSSLLSGARPAEMDWYRVEHPEWYVADGWALTPEAAGVAAADRHGPGYGPIEGRLSRAAASGGTLMIGGRSFDPAASPRLTVAVDGRNMLDETLGTGPFLKWIQLPAGGVDRAAGDYAVVSVTSTPAVNLAVEQFDASSTRPLVGFGSGWQEQEFNPRTGVRWRWLSERGELQFRSPSPSVVLHLEGESPLTYFKKGSRLVVKAAGAVVFDRQLVEDFALDIPVPAQAGAMTLETDQVFSPADRSKRTADRRHLGLRIFKCEVRKP